MTDTNMLDDGEDELNGELDGDHDMNLDDDGLPNIDNQEEHRAALIEKLLQSGKDLRSLAQVLQSKKFIEIIKRVEEYSASNKSNNAGKNWSGGTTVAGGPLEEDPEYKLIVAANHVVPDLESDIAIVHKYISDYYNQRFPELLGLVRNPVDYAKIVKALANHLDTSVVDLRMLLPASVAVMVNVTASTTAGTAITDSHQLQRALEGCELMLELDAARGKIITYIESRMMLISPNLSAIVSSSVAAKLMGAAGGLAALCKIPACNILVLGQTKRVSMGLSNIGMARHRGFVWDSDFVRFSPSEYKRKAARLISAKICLCARLDLSHAQRDGSYGRQIRQDIEQKLGKAMAPPPNKGIKALPVPDEAPKKRRGGRRARKLKEQYAMTDIRRAANRVAFGVEENEISSFGSSRGLGLLSGTSSSGTGSGIGSGKGKIRAATADPKLKAKTSQRLKAQLRAIGGVTTTSGFSTSFGGTSSTAFGRSLALNPSRTAEGSTTTSGTATSLAFTPVQGLEFADPSAQAQKVKDANERWFSDKSAFSKKEG